MQRSGTNGFTLVELLVTLLIAAISLTLGVPSFVRFVDRNELQSVSAELVSTFQDARERAVTQGEDVILDQQSTSVTCTYQDDGSPESCDGLDLADSGITITGVPQNNNTITFNSSGLSNRDLRLLVKHDDVTTHQYEIRILNSGRISLTQKNI